MPVVYEYLYGKKIVISFTNLSLGDFVFVGIRYSVIKLLPTVYYRKNQISAYADEIYATMRIFT